jgi:O-antigen ligase
VIFGFLLAVCFNPYIYTAATHPRWEYLAIALPIMIALFPSRNHFSLNHLSGLIFLTWSALTLLWTPNILDGCASLIQLLIVAEAFVLGARLPTLKPTMTGLALGLSISSLILISPQLQQILPHQFVAIDTEGLLGNPNMLAEAACLTLIGCIGYKLWWTLPLLLPAVLIPQARGAMLGLASAMVIAIWSRSKTLAISLMLLGIYAIAILTGHKLGAGSSISERLIVWADTIKGLTFFGHGLGSFEYLFPFLTHHFDGAISVVDHPHNELLEIWFETGAVGLGLYCLLVAASFGSADSITRPILAAFVVIGMFAFPSHMPVTAFIGALALGHAARNGMPLWECAEHIRLALRAWHGRSSKPATADRAFQIGAAL